MNNSPYQQKMQKNVRVFGWFVLILISTFIAGWIYLACHEGIGQPSVTRIVAMRPNKTWHWLVLDSAGYKIAIVKAKRRDSL